MNAVIQSSAHPLVALKRSTLIIHLFIDRLSAYTGSIFRVSGLHRHALWTWLLVQSPRYVPALQQDGCTFYGRQYPLHRFFFLRAPLRHRFFLMLQEFY